MTTNYFPVTFLYVHFFVLELSDLVIPSNCRTFRELLFYELYGNLNASLWLRQMGGIDEAALDKLSLVTEMTKHIQVRASSSSKGASASEIGQFSPLFLWLLRVSFLYLYLTAWA